MAIIIDACCLSSVFHKTDSLHHKYAPVLDWINKRNGFMIYGGTKYLEEFKKVKSVVRIVNLLKPHKVIVLDKKIVDKEMARVKALIPDKEFNDPHLVAISIVGRCKIICTRDKKCSKFVRSRKLYPNGFTPPVFYIDETCAKYLNGKYIHKSYKSHSKK